MSELSKVWRQQCEAAREIRGRYGTEKALGYLVGEKLVEFLRASDTRPEFAMELPSFVERVKEVFTASEIRTYLENLTRVGAPGHTLTDEEYYVMREAGAFGHDIARGAEDAILVERIKELLAS